MNSKERNSVVRRFGYCENCLARSHDLRACQSLDLCRKCDSYHHTLLHPTRATNDLRRQINRQQNQRNNHRQARRRSSNVNNNCPSSNNNRQSTNQQHVPAVPDQQIISEAIRSLAQVLCAQPTGKST